MKYWIIATALALALISAVLWLLERPAGDRRHAAGGAAQPATSMTPNASSRSAGGERGVLVVTASVTEAIVNDRLQAVGSGTAKSSVSVVPLSAGLLTDILVESGQRVERGDVLALLDDDEERIARDRAASTASNAAVEEARLAELFRTRTTTEAELIRARATLADANLALREAELALARRRITAPISGYIGLIPVDPGNYVTSQDELLTIDDRETIIVQFWVPERFAGQVRVGQPIEAIPQAAPSRSHKGKITGIGSRVESDSRTLPIEAELDNREDKLRPGMSFNLTLAFVGETYPAINPLAIQWDSTGSYVWKRVADTVERIAVRIIQRNPERVLVSSDLRLGDEVVIEGLFRLRPGASVRVQNRGGSNSGTTDTVGSSTESRANSAAGNSTRP